MNRSRVSRARGSLQVFAFILLALIGLAGADWTPTSSGDRTELVVVSGGSAIDELPSWDPNAYEHVGGDGWSEIELELPHADSSVTSVSLLRPDAWLELTGAQVGGSVYLDLPEMGVRGDASVLEIRDARELPEASDGLRHITGKFVTTNVSVLDLSIEGVDEPIGVTPSHPFWSVDRECWIAAGELAEGERVLGASGPLAVVSAEARAERETVYNIEVHRDHTFFVTSEKVWVHNGCSKAVIDLLGRAKPTQHGGKASRIFDMAGGARQAARDFRDLVGKGAEKLLARNGAAMRRATLPDGTTVMLRGYSGSRSGARPTIEIQQSADMILKFRY